MPKKSPWEQDRQETIPGEAKAVVGRKVTYRVHQSRYSREQAERLGIKWEPPIERTGVIVSGPDRNGMLHINGNYVHWTDVKSYYPNKPGYF